MKLIERIRNLFKEVVVVQDATPPGHLGMMVKGFAKYFPEATVGEWITFATKHADNAWLHGYRAGWEARPTNKPPAPIEYLVRNALEGVDLSKPVVLQAPEGYEHVAFVDEKGVRYE